MGFLNPGEKARAVDRHYRDQMHADQVRRVRENGKNIGLSRREVERRVTRVNKRFGR